jgi:uncharacterized protein
MHQYGDYRVSTALGAGPVTLQVSSAYPDSGAVSVHIIEAPAEELALRLRVPGWARGAAELSEPPTTRAPGYIEIRRVFRVGESIDVTFPVVARATYPDARIDAVRGTFAVEQGPPVLALESPDLPPGWSVNEITADPASLDSSEAGTTIDVRRRPSAPEGWPYDAESDDREGERVRTRLIPYHQWANRGPATMRIWLPISTRRTRVGKQAE